MVCKYIFHIIMLISLFQASNRKSLSMEAIDKLGSHVVDPNKREKKLKDAPPTGLSDLKREAQNYISHLATVLPTLPNLPAPALYPGTWEMVCN